MVTTRTFSDNAYNGDNTLMHTCIHNQVITRTYGTMMVTYDEGYNRDIIRPWGKMVILSACNILGQL